MNENQNRESIEKSLTKSVFKVSTMAAAAAVLGVIALIVIAGRYSYALKNFGFAQGDIGKAMFEFADLRSSLRAAIGYDDADAIDTVVRQHDEGKVLFAQYFAEIEKTIVSEAGRETYDAISAELDAYWKLDGEIMDMGATTDRELCKQAQELALNDLAPMYNSIYSKLDELLEVKVNEGNDLSRTLLILSAILVAAIISVIIIAMVLSVKMGKGISKKIANPLKKLGARLEIFATGDLSSPFPVISTGDEVEDMAKDATNMADNLNIIIKDIGDVLGEMASGNYAVKSKVPDKYTGDFSKLYQSMRGLRDREPGFTPPKPHFLYKVEADTDGQFFVQAFLVTKQAEFLPGPVLFSGGEDVCFDLSEDLNCGILVQDDFFTASEARESCYTTKDGAALVALVGPDKEVYLGRRDHYDGHGHYRNDEKSLIHISDTYRVFNLISGHDTPYSYDELHGTRMFSEKEFARFMDLQLEGTKQPRDHTRGTFSQPETRKRVEKKSVLAKLSVPLPRREHKKSAPKKSAERDR